MGGFLRQDGNRSLSGTKTASAYGYPRGFKQSFPVLINSDVIYTQLHYPEERLHVDQRSRLDSTTVHR